MKIKRFFLTIIVVSGISVSSLSAQNMIIDQRNDQTMRVEPEKPNLFYIIYGSFRYRENAERAVQHLTGLGFKPFVIIKTDGLLYRVVVDEPLASKREAVNAMNYFKSNFKSDAWVYTPPMIYGTRFAENIPVLDSQELMAVSTHFVLSFSSTLKL